MQKRLSVKHFTMAVFLTLLSFTTKNIEAQTALNLTLEKSVFLVDEQIWIEVEEKNISNESVFSSILRPSADLYCKIKLRDSKGKEWPYRGGVGFIPYQPNWKGYELAPQESRFLVKEILGIFGNQDESHRFVFHLPPEHYSLQIILHANYHWIAGFNELVKSFGEEAHNIADKRTVISNAVEFEIIEPTGIEKSVHNKLLNAYRLTWQIKQGSKVQKDIVPIFESILNENPNSVYTIATHMGLRTTFSEDYGNRMNLTKDLYRFRNNIYCKSLIDPLKKETALENLPKLKVKYPGSKLAKYIDHEFKYGRLKGQQ